jgi:hypothetical protein
VVPSPAPGPTGRRSGSRPIRCPTGWPEQRALEIVGSDGPPGDKLERVAILRGAELLLDLADLLGELEGVRGHRVGGQEEDPDGWGSGRHGGMIRWFSLSCEVVGVTMIPGGAESPEDVALGRVR